MCPNVASTCNIAHFFEKYSRRFFSSTTELIEIVLYRILAPLYYMNYQMMRLIYIVVISDLSISCGLFVTGFLDTGLLLFVFV